MRDSATVLSSDRPLEDRRVVVGQRIQLAEGVRSRLLRGQSHREETNHAVTDRHVAALEGHDLVRDAPVEAVGHGRGEGDPGALALIDQAEEEMADLVALEAAERRRRLDHRLVLAIERAALLMNAVDDVAQVVDEVFLAPALDDPPAEVGQPPPGLLGLDMVLHARLKRDDHEDAHLPDAFREPGAALALGEHAEVVALEGRVSEIHLRTLEDEEDAVGRLDAGEKTLPGLGDVIKRRRIEAVHAGERELGEEQELPVHGQDGVRSDEAPVRNVGTQTALLGLEEIHQDDLWREEGAMRVSARTSRTYGPYRSGGSPGSHHATSKRELRRRTAKKCGSRFVRKRQAKYAATAVTTPRRNEPTPCQSIPKRTMSRPKSRRSMFISSGGLQRTWKPSHSWSPRNETPPSIEYLPERQDS